MTIDVAALRALEIRDMRFTFSERDTMLYALSVGMGANSLDAAELPFVYEGAGLRAVPTMAVADPKVAARAGFERPILHGLATYGIACRAVLKACNYRAADLRTFDARFSAPVYPGDEVVTEIWNDGKDISFRARVPARDIVVLNNGRCTLDAPK